jgi:prophage regulatory protein
MRLLRFPDLSDRVGLRHSAIYDAIRKGTFPKPVSLGRKAVAWLESEVDAWINARIAERDAATPPKRRRGRPRKWETTEVMTKTKTAAAKATAAAAEAGGAET